ncbi:MAG: chemotaxis protein CheW, partial [Gemmatimonadetes bacterium]|nr:chemotaxis protein CheW [Gemmatimonadota bacterium]
TRLPGCGPAVCGLIGLRGRVITAFDLGAALALRPSAARPDHRLLLVEYGPRLVALAVEEVVGVARAAARELPIEARALRLIDVDRDDLVGIGDLGERAFLALDTDRVIGRLLG